MVRVVVYVPQETHSELKQRLREDGLSVSFWVRSQMGLYLTGPKKISSKNSKSLEDLKPIYDVMPALEDMERKRVFESMKKKPYTVRSDIKCIWKKSIGGTTYPCPNFALEGSEFCKLHQADS